MRGSIRKRTLKAKKDGKPVEVYYILYDLPPRWDEAKGCYRRRQKWERVEEPNALRHAEKVLAKRLQELHAGEFIEPSAATFREFADTWIETYARGQVKPTTLARHLSTLRTHLTPVLGDIPLRAIGAEEIQRLKAERLDAGLSPQSVRNMLALVRQMLDHAVDWGRLRANPARKVAFPRVPRAEVDFLSPDEVRALLEHVPAQWYAFFLTAVTTALRLGELLAMRWANVDWKQGRYLVRETLARKSETEDAGLRSTKTEGSAQSVDLSPACVRALEAHRARQAQEKLQAGTKYRDQDLVFATPHGTWWNDRNVVQRVFEPALKAAGIRRIRFHDLRHTTASLLIAQGESPKYIQQQMRHATIQITFDRYGHLFPEASRQAMARMDEALFGRPAGDSARAR